MKQYRIVILFIHFILLSFFSNGQSYIFHPSKLRLFWKNSKGIPFKSFSNVKKEHPELIFMMNAGMYTTSNFPSPVGLYIEKGVKLRKIKIINNRAVNYGIPPSGIFYFNSNSANIIKAYNWSNRLNAQYATQSGPMLLVNRLINKNLPRGSYIMRNGVGVRADGKVVFACFRTNFINFAIWFKNQNCINALYLDGGVSDYWVPGSLFNFGKYGPIVGAVDK